jgi:hypothetical protein
VGAWTARFGNVPPAQLPAAGDTVTITSTQGGLLIDEQINLRN